MSDNDKTKTELVMENVHLRRKLAEAEARAERMEKRYKGQLAHNEGLEVSIRARKEQIKGLKAEREELLKSNPSEAERRILEMWPRFEDGEPVMVGDQFSQSCGVGDIVEQLRFEDANVRLLGESGYDSDLGVKPTIKRPAPDSWERMFGDASVGACCYFGRVGKDGTERCEGCPAEQADCCMSTQMEDLIRRAKKLAGVE